MTFKFFSLLTASLLLLVSCAKKAPLYQVNEEPGFLVMASQDQGQVHGEKFWFTKEDSLRVKSEMWYLGSQHGPSVQLDSKNPSCLLYVNYKQGQEKGSDQSESCGETVTGNSVTQAFESDEQVLFNYSKGVSDWAASLKSQAVGSFSAEVANDHSFQMGLESAIKQELLKTLKMSVDRPEWEKLLSTWNPQQVKMPQWKIQGEYSQARTPQSTQNSIDAAMARAGYPRGSQTLGFEWGFLYGQYAVQTQFRPQLIKKQAWLNANKYQAEVIESLFKGSELPQVSGEWSGQPGNSYWMSYDESILLQTQGEGILFYSQIPAVSPWSQAGMLINPLQPDKNSIIQKFQSRNKWSQEEVQSYIQEKSLSPFQVSNDRVELIPSVLASELEQVMNGLSTES